MMPDLRSEFIEAATWHGELHRANELLSANPHLAQGNDLHIAAILGDHDTVRRLIVADSSLVGTSAPPYDAEPLVLLCLSKYLRLDPAQSDAFLRTARTLLDAGADPNGGFTMKGDHPERETALYGAAGVAHHEAMTRLLLEHGADPNDGEVVYHSPESDDLDAIRALVETGRLTRDSFIVMLVRKIDWHDRDGVAYLLEVGAAATDGWRDLSKGLHHAIQRDNSEQIIELLLQYGADTKQTERGLSAVALAAQRGRGDLLALFDRLGHGVTLVGRDALLSVCARGDAEAVHAIARRTPEAVQELLADGARWLAQFAGTANATGVGLLLDLGVPVNARYGGDGYFGLAAESTALHVASWRARHAVVEVLIERGADVNARDGRGRTPLMLAVEATVDSYWMERRSTKSIRALVDAGADRSAISQPTGYSEADDLLAR